MFTTITINSKEYELSLRIKEVVLLEKYLGMGVLQIFGAQGERIPTVTEMIGIFHYSLQRFNHGITMTDSQNLFSKWLQEGNTVTDFISVIVDIFRECGLFGKESKDDSDVNEESKN